MFKLRALGAAVLLALGFHTPEALAQATQIPAAKTCFQATTGLTGMVGATGFLVGGSGGTAGTYANVTLSGGLGNSATANITVGSGGAVTDVAIVNPGVQYGTGDVLSASSASIGNVSGFSITVLSVSINSSLAGGTVGMYIPNTLTIKQTWKNAAQTILNTNPVALDNNGCALIYGSGTYRQILKDSLGNTVWDQPTTPTPVNPYYAGNAGGTPNAITLNWPSFAAVDGQAVNFIAANTNTGATTITPSATGSPIPVVKNTPIGPAPLSGGEIVTGNMVTAIYSASLNEFFIQSSSGTLSPSQLPNRAVSPFSFGAKCDGAADDTTAIQNAINSLSGSGGIVQFANVTCNVSGTLTMASNGVHLVGAGIGATILNCIGTGANDCIKLGTFPTTANCIGSSAPSNCGQTYDLYVSDMTIKSSTRGGGYAININGASQVVISDIYYTAWALTSVQYVNNVVFSRLNGTTSANTGAAINLSNAITAGTTAGWYRSDVITFNDVDLNAQNAGANCIVWDGPEYTVRINHMALISCAYGVYVENTAGSTSYYPAFLQANDLEVDFSANTALNIAAGEGFSCVNCYFNAGNSSSVSYRPLTILPDLGGSYTHNIYLANSQFHDAYGEAAYISARDVTIVGSQFFDSNHGGTGTQPTIEIGNDAENIIITGSALGRGYGSPDAPNYGVWVDSGNLGPITLGNNSFSGASSQNINNLSSVAVGWTGGIGYNNVMNTATTCAATTMC